jgi:hypothetical protein
MEYSAVYLLLVEKVLQNHNITYTWQNRAPVKEDDEQDMWSLVGKNPKEMGVLEKHNTKVSL